MTRAWRPFLVGAAVALAGKRFFIAGRQRLATPVEETFGASTGRGKSQQAPSSDSLAQGFEVADANGRALALTMAIFACSAALAIGGTAVALKLFSGGRPGDAHLTAEQRHSVSPPEPHLQADPVSELARFQARQAASTKSSRLLSPGLAQIPVSRAMELMAGHSLDAPPDMAP